MTLAALVTDAEVRSSVWAIRGLGRAGIQVVALGSGRSAAGTWSRFATHTLIGPSAAQDAAGFLDVVAEAARRHGPLVVYPGQEQSLSALLAAPLPPTVHLPYSSSAAVLAIRDKRSLGDRAAAAGLQTPPTYHEGPIADLDGAAVPEYPCIIKPLEKGTALRVPSVVRSQAELERLLDSLPQTETVILQPRVEGALMALSVIISRTGRPVAVFQQEATATWPSEAGPSRTAVGVAPDEELLDRVVRMLTAARFWGLAQVQFIKPAGGGAPQVVDVNPRYYGSIPLAISSGVNLPALWHAVVAGHAVAASPGRYEAGVTYRWLEADLLATLHNHDRSLFQRMPPRRVGAMWAPDDPVAGVALAMAAFGTWLARRVPSRTQR